MGRFGVSRSASACSRFGAGNQVRKALFENLAGRTKHGEPSDGTGKAPVS